jgi:hypothetical protein
MANDPIQLAPPKRRAGHSGLQLVAEISVNMRYGTHGKSSTNPQFTNFVGLQSHHASHLLA